MCTVCTTRRTQSIFMNPPVLFASPAPDSSDRFKTLKTDSILPYIWPRLNPQANSHDRMAERRLTQRGAIPIQILPSSFLLSYINLISPSLSPILGFSLHLPCLFNPSSISFPFSIYTHTHSCLWCVSSPFLFSLSLPMSLFCFFFFTFSALSANALVPPLPHISLSSLPVLLTFSLYLTAPISLLTSLITSILSLHFFSLFFPFFWPLPPPFPLSQAVCNVAEENTVCQPESDRWAGSGVRGWEHRINPHTHKHTHTYIYTHTHFISAWGAAANGQRTLIRTHAHTLTMFQQMTAWQAWDKTLRPWYNPDTGSQIKYSDAGLKKRHYW